MTSAEHTENICASADEKDGFIRISRVDAEKLLKMIEDVRAVLRGDAAKDAEPQRGEPT